MTDVKGFFTTESTPRWWLIAGAVLLFLQSCLFYQMAASDARVAAEQGRIEQRLLAIESNSVDFQTFANAFVASVLDGSDDAAQRRDQLIANILAQDAAIDVARPMFSGALDNEISTYRAALRGMKAAVEQVDGVVSLSHFWSAASDLLVARNHLLEAIEAHSRSMS